jgi:hypothetical protein
MLALNDVPGSFGIDVAAGSREIMGICQTNTYPLLHSSTTQFLFAFYTIQICIRFKYDTSKFLCRTSFIICSFTANSRNIVSEIIGAPSPYHSSPEFLAQPFKAALNPTTSLRLFSGEKMESGFGF